MSAPPDAPRFPLAIIGAGALGLHFAARLAGCGPVALVARSDAQAAALRAGTRIGGVLFQAQAFGPAALPRADWVILLVKTGNTLSAAATARALAPRGIVSLQNGLVDHLLQAACPGLLAGQGITTAGAWRAPARPCSRPASKPLRRDSPPPAWRPGSSRRSPPPAWPSC